MYGMYGNAMDFNAANSGIQNFTQTLQQNLDQYGELNANAKVADAMVKANPDLPQRMGMLPGQFEGLSAADKVAAVTGYTKAQGVQEFLAKNQMMQAQLQDYQAQAQQRQAQAQDDQGFSNYAAALDQQVNNPDTNNPSAVKFAQSVPAGVKFQIHAAAQAGRTNPRVGAAMIKPMMEYFGPNGEGGQLNTPIQSQDLGNGRIGYRMPGSHQFEIFSSSSAATQPVYDENNNLIGNNIPNGRGGWIYKPVQQTRNGPKGNGRTMSADGKFYWDDKDETWKPYGGARGKPDAITILKDAIGMNASPSASAGPGPQPLPLKNGRPDPSLMKSGMVYQTARGPATWDGKQFQQQ